MKVTNETKPKQLIRPIPVDWWLKKDSYTRFMIRDATSIFIAGYCVFLLYVLCRSSNQAAFDAFYKTWATPTGRVLHILALVFALYHSVTFFNLTPQVIVQYRGDEKVPGYLIALGHYALWLAVSVIIIWIGMAV